MKFSLLRKIIALCFFILFFFNVSYSFSQWVVQNLPSASGKTVSLDYSDINHGIVCGGFFDFDRHAKAYYTTDRGETWHSASVPDSGKFFYSVKFINSFMAYMGGEYQSTGEYVFPSDVFKGSGRKAFFLKSTNYGKDWAGIASPDLYKFNNLEAIDFINEDQGVAIANNNEAIKGFTDKIIITTNSGSSWNLSFPMNDTIPVDLVSVQYVSDNLIYSAGNYHQNNTYKGMLFKSTDLGLFWEITSIDDLIINNISFTDRVTGYLLGLNSKNSFSSLYKTSDGGENWILLRSFEDNYYTGVSFLKESGTGMLFGFRIFYENPAVSLTTDYGITWRNQSIPPTNDVLLSDGVILNSEEMNITGGELFSNGIVLHTTNGGWTYVNNNSGLYGNQIFDLYQNFPNPFNPSTLIKYELKQNSIVSLKVYNISGSEAAVLVNGKQDRGVHSVNFNGNLLPSGIYFYKLESDSYIETKKMILIR